MIVLAVEAPHKGMSLYAPEEMTSTPAPISSTSDTEYFPARFPAPKAEAEPVAPTF
jgi:hypothetical protein